VRLVCRLLLITVIGGLAVTVMSSPASAHGQLAMTTPAKDSTVKTPIEAVLLYFTEPPRPNSYFTIFTPSGVRVDRPWTSAEPKRLDEPVREDHLIDGVWQPQLYYTGYPAKIPVGYWPEQGVYTARYMTVASDGEPVRGEVHFTYMGKMSQAPEGWQTPTNQPDPSVAGTGGATAGPQTAPPTGSAAPVASCAPGSMPETGCDTGSPQSVSTGTSATASAESDSGTGLLVWLVPAVLVAGTGFMVIRAARRPSPSDRTSKRAPGPPGRSPLAQRVDTPRRPSPKTGKRR
jgi:methionine-rich copper-binding protein CopC